MAVLKGAIPWWSIPVNWTIGEYLDIFRCCHVRVLNVFPVVFFGNLVGSLFFAAVLSKCWFAFIGIAGLFVLIDSANVQMTDWWYLIHMPLT